MALIRQALVSGFLLKEIENYGLIRLSSKGESFLKNPTSFSMTEDHKYEIINATEFKSTNKSDVFFDKALMKILIKLRKDVAKVNEDTCFVYDPFVGTGSLLLMASKSGAKMPLGSDIKIGNGQDNFSHVIGLFHLKRYPLHRTQVALLCCKHQRRPAVRVVRAVDVGARLGQLRHRGVEQLQPCEQQATRQLVQVTSSMA